MKVTIVADDNMVGTDGIFVELPLAEILPNGVHAVQADDATGVAEIEYSPTPAEWDLGFSPPKLITPAGKPHNEVISMAEFRRRFADVLSAHAQAVKAATP